MKTTEQYFADWEGTAFGFGYGSGEEHIIPALRTFLEHCDNGPHVHAYDFRHMEEVLTAPVAWFLINVLCRQHVIEYGTSPRFGWLTPEGERLRDFMLDKTVEQLVEIVTGRTENDDVCYPDACNCGPQGYDPKAVCQNPFWPHRDKAKAA